MSNGWSPTPVALGNPVPLTVAGVQAGMVVSKEFRITAGGACVGLAVKIDTAATTVAGSITAKLQTAVDSEWEDSKTVSVTGNGRFYIQLLSNRTADQQYMPLLAKGRVVIVNTNAGDTTQISSIDVLQEL